MNYKEVINLLDTLSKEEIDYVILEMYKLHGDIKYLPIKELTTLCEDNSPKLTQSIDDQISPLFIHSPQSLDPEILEKAKEIFTLIAEKLKAISIPLEELFGTSGQDISANKFFKKLQELGIALSPKSRLCILKFAGYKEDEYVRTSDFTSLVNDYTEIEEISKYIDAEKNKSNEETEENDIDAKSADYIKPLLAK